MHIAISYVWYRISRFFRRIGRFCAYVPVIWRDEDWDWAPILTMTRYKIQRTHDYIKYHGHCADQEPQLALMEEAVEVIGRIVAEKYCDQEMVAHYKKWFTEERWEEQSNGTMRMIPMSEEQRKEWKPIYDKSIQLAEADWNRLFDILKNHMRDWSD